MYARPLEAKRYYHETFVWQYTGARLILTFRRERKTILIAKVGGISPKSFLIQTLICGEGTGLELELLAIANGTSLQH